MYSILTTQHLQKEHSCFCKSISSMTSFKEDQQGMLQGWQSYSCLLIMRLKGKYKMDNKVELEVTTGIKQV